jgi:stage II sporulation protein D
MLRRLPAILFVVAATASAAGAAAPTAARGVPQFVISGHGWGHGVGMSQYGAYGYAQRGYTYKQILAHYYPGTELGRAPVSRVRVLLGSSATATVASQGAVKLKDATGTTTTLPAGAWKLGIGLKLKLPGDDQAQPLAGPLTFLPTTQPLSYAGRTYRGTFVVASDGKSVSVVDNVDLEQYLYGVVPSEMPYSWSTEALKAQAVVARSYALAVRKSGGAFDLYPDTRSQVYRGIAGEQESTTAAVDATADQVLLYDGKVAVTYFYSTSGGRTAAISDVWNSVPVPYLVSVPDPYDSISPYHAWGPYSYTAAKLDAALKVPGTLVDVETATNASGRIATLTAHGTGGDVTLTGEQVRAKLGLRSTWFRVGVLALDPLPAKPVPYGAVVALTGVGRGIAGLKLQQRVPGETDWSAGTPVKARPDGSLALSVKAGAPGQYRLAAGTITTRATTLFVQPTVRLKLPTAPTALSGVVTPAIADARVQVQRASGEEWATVVTLRSDSTGAFSASFAVTPGTYRARVSAGHGWAVAFSPELLVVKT